MNISNRAAHQIRSLEPDDCANVLDYLRDQRIRSGVQIITIEAASGRTYRAFVGRAKDQSIVLISVVESRARAP